MARVVALAMSKMSALSIACHAPDCTVEAVVIVVVLVLMVMVVVVMVAVIQENSGWWPLIVVSKIFSL